MKAALTNYSASDPNDVSTNLSGQAFEFMVGAEYRKDFGEEKTLLDSSFFKPYSVFQVAKREFLQVQN